MPAGASWSPPRTTSACGYGMRSPARRRGRDLAALRSGTEALARHLVAYWGSAGFGALLAGWITDRRGLPRRAGGGRALGRGPAPALSPADRGDGCGRSAAGGLVRERQ